MVGREFDAEPCWFFKRILSPVKFDMCCRTSIGPRNLWLTRLDCRQSGEFPSGFLIEYKNDGWLGSNAELLQNAYAREHGLRQFSVYQGKWNVTCRDLERDVSLFLTSWSVNYVRIHLGNFRKFLKSWWRHFPHLIFLLPSWNFRENSSPAEVNLSDFDISDRLFRCAAPSTTETVWPSVPGTFLVAADTRLTHKWQNKRSLVTKAEICPYQVLADPKPIRR